MLVHDLRGDVTASAEQPGPRDFVDVPRLLVEPNIRYLKNNNKKRNGTALADTGAVLGQIGCTRCIVRPIKLSHVLKFSVPEKF